MTPGPLQKRLAELALRAVYGGAPTFTRFLEPAVANDVRAAAKAAGADVALWGGYEDAERVMAAFFFVVAPEREAYPIAALRIEWNDKFAHPAHRDLLGAAMGLGVERDTLGDIALGRRHDAPCAWLFCAEEVADYVCASFESAGRASVKVIAETETPGILPPEGTAMRATVQQLRLDAVVAAACRLSRSEAQRRIAAGLVKLNHVPCLRADARLEAGDLLSVRGHGRVRVDALQGESRRGRQVVSLFLYGGK